MGLHAERWRGANRDYSMKLKVIGLDKWLERRDIVMKRLGDVFRAELE